MKIIKVASSPELVNEILVTLSQVFNRVRENPEAYNPTVSMLFSDRWVKTTGQKPIEHWGGNFYSMLEIYKKFLDRGKEERASQYLSGILDLNICDNTHEYWLGEFDDVFKTDLSSKWKQIVA
jgi:hypothetical protein